ncbi:OmpH family outer membrane protein [Flavobacterium sp. NRK1]|uniref:OmpH family outer membrane protein n=1 Tax=Flavobacterium sp. NRK1 TaxID=2954929 RepID=UPI002093ACC8|nr:OmpH family outer membrane protein [Flavobacterium sp. NRK1]MCO6147168.1 OmpH family outer membrane protein [Flavobacterium sp. NRK1]
MKKSFFTVLIALVALMANAQSRGIKIAYLDMNYILDKVPDYADAKNQLEQKATKWKQELEVKRNEISKLKESLQQEKPLLTKELIEEREEEILFQEKELIDYQEKRFGPMGDLVTQKAVLIKPIQDQVFTIAQDLAEIRKYDFVFDKSSDLTMIVAAKKHDISDYIITKMTRAAKQEKLSSRELKKFEEQEAKEEHESNPDYIERQKILEERKNARDKKIEERKALQEEKKKAYEEKRARLKAERDAKRNGTAVPPAETTPSEGSNIPFAPKSNKDANDNGDKTETKTTSTDKKAAASEAAAERQNAIDAAREERERKIEEKKKAQDERKKQILEQREAAKKAREEKLKKKEEETTAPAGDDSNTEEETPSNP